LGLSWGYLGLLEANLGLSWGYLGLSKIPFKVLSKALHKALTAFKRPVKGLLKGFERLGKRLQKGHLSFVEGLQKAFQISARRHNLSHTPSTSREIHETHWQTENDMSIL
jgi:hypothetical protein